MLDSAQPERVLIPIGRVQLEGDLALPPAAVGIVLFAHGSGSSRHSPRNRYVAAQLQNGGLGTLLIDLLTSEEEAIDARTGHLRFDIELLAKRLVGVIDWLSTGQSTGELSVGVFGASTGGGAALVAAADRPHSVRAVVSRGGRPDLAGSALVRVRAPTLLIVGGNDHEVIELNRMAMSELRAETHLEIVPGATHLFEEEGALERVAALARAWFQQHLTPARAATRHGGEGDQRVA